MRAVVQRVSEASVTVEGEVVGEIGKGFLVLLGAGHGDTEADVDYLVNKISGLRVFEDDDGKMNLALKDVGGSMLVVSQFTLFGDTRKGRRPSFVDAMEPGEAERLYEVFVSQARETSIPVETGVFAASMKVNLLNDGPVTLILETRDGRGVKLAE